MKTQIFKSYSEFKQRSDRSINGVDESFAKEHPNYEVDNSTNKGCWNCYECSECYDCDKSYGCTR